MKVILIIVGIFIALIAFNMYLESARRSRLLEKYNDPDLVDRIMQRKIWIGMTQGHLVDSIGKPLHIDQKVLKTKTKETWKYNKTGSNRYALRITVENKEVIGWDDKR